MVVLVRWSRCKRRVWVIVCEKTACVVLSVDN